MFDDPEQLVIAYLTEALSELVTTQVPNPRPDKFVRILLTGNRRLNVAHRLAQVTVEAWDAASEASAAQFGEQVYAALSAWWRVPQGSNGWLGGPYSTVDPLTGCPRYAMTCYVSQKVTS